MTWWERLIGWTGTVSSAQSAKERLQLVLIHDRTDVTPATIELIKDEIIAVIQKHVAIDAGQVETKVFDSCGKRALGKDLRAFCSIEALFFEHAENLPIADGGQAAIVRVADEA